MKHIHYVIKLSTSILGFVAPHLYAPYTNDDSQVSTAIILQHHASAIDPEAIYANGVEEIRIANPSQQIRITHVKTLSGEDPIQLSFTMSGVSHLLLSMTGKHGFQIIDRKFNRNQVIHVELMGDDCLLRLARNHGYDFSKNVIMKLMLEQECNIDITTQKGITAFEKLCKKKPIISKPS